jgi:hypothetical protein
MLQELTSSFGLGRLQFATRDNAILKIVSQHIADLAHLPADGVDLELKGGIHFGGAREVVSLVDEVESACN